MNELYRGREQSGTKHRLVEQYLEKLAYKILVSKRARTLTYIDAFSGPWNSASEDFSDTSFARAVATLKRVQQQTSNKLPDKPHINGIFVERDTDSFVQLKAFVDAHTAPANGLSLIALDGEFESRVAEIDEISSDSFRLTFIDPTGWTGYSFAKISPLLKGRNSEVIVNFMYDHVNRFIQDGRTSIQESFRPILGEGVDDWLKLKIDREGAIVSRFCENLKAASDYKHVISMPVSKPKSDRTHFILAFGTNSIHGMIEFRDAERRAQHHHAAVKAQLRDDQADQGQLRLFETAKPSAEYKLKQQFERLKRSAREHIVEVSLAKRPEIKFEYLAAELLERFPLRMTEIRQLCAELAQEGVIEPSWKRRGTRKQKPDLQDMIQLRR